MNIHLGICFRDVYVYHLISKIKFNFTCTWNEYCRALQCLSMKAFNFFGAFFSFVSITLLESSASLNKSRTSLIFMISSNVTASCTTTGLPCSLSLENLCFKRERVGFRDSSSAVLTFGCLSERSLSFFNVDAGLTMYSMLASMEFLCRHTFCRPRFNRLVQRSAGLLKL